MDYTLTMICKRQSFQSINNTIQVKIIYFCDIERFILYHKSKISKKYD